MTADILSLAQGGGVGLVVAPRMDDAEYDADREFEIVGGLASGMLDAAARDTIKWGDSADDGIALVAYARASAAAAAALRAILRRRGEKGIVVLVADAADGEAVVVVSRRNVAIERVDP